MDRETEGKVRAAVRGLPSEPVCRAGQEQAPGTSTGGDQDEPWWRGACQSKRMLVPKQVLQEGLREGKEMSGLSQRQGLFPPVKQRRP